MTAGSLITFPHLALIASLGLGIPLLLILIAVVIFVLYRRHRRRRRSASAAVENNLNEVRVMNNCAVATIGDGKIEDDPSQPCFASASASARKENAYPAGANKFNNDLKAADIDSSSESGGNQHMFDEKYLEQSLPDKNNHKQLASETKKYNKNLLRLSDNHKLKNNVSVVNRVDRVEDSALDVRDVPLNEERMSAEILNSGGGGQFGTDASAAVYDGSLQRHDVTERRLSVIGSISIDDRGEHLNGEDDIFVVSYRSGNGYR